MKCRGGRQSNDTIDELASPFAIGIARLHTAMTLLQALAFDTDLPFSEQVAAVTL
jgi:hypothetical protein